MTDPVVLPDSSVTVDRSTIERHLSIQVGDGTWLLRMASQYPTHMTGPGQERSKGGGTLAFAAPNLMVAGTE